MEVVETVVFRFESGTFTHVFRELPRRRTDAIEIVSAEMDGRALAFGKESGQVEVKTVEAARPVAIRSAYGLDQYVRAHLHRAGSRPASGRT